MDMDMTLSDIEVRVLGCLIEKELTTPEYYPLSLNSLTNACNQKSNRDPVTAMSEEDIIRALDSLRFRQLIVISADGGRVPKYRHLLAEKLGLIEAELAIICELLVRGPQTVGELRTRSERMHPFTDLAAVEDVLNELMALENPLVKLLPRLPGRKEGRYTQLFSEIPETPIENHISAPEAARVRVMAENSRIENLETELTALRTTVTELQQQMAEFKAQFE